MTQEQQPHYPVHRDVAPYAGGYGTGAGIGTSTNAGSGIGTTSTGTEYLGDRGAVVGFLILENESGAAVPLGSAVKLALGGGDLAFTTSTTVDDERVFGVTLEAISISGKGRVAMSGRVRRALVSSGTTAGQWLRQSSSAGVLEGINDPTIGTFAVSITDRDTDGYSSILLARFPLTGAPHGGLTIYGDGSDGDATISGDTTLTGDKFYSSLTVDSGKTLTTAGYRVFVLGTATLNGKIVNNGADGATGVAGGAGGVLATTQLGGGSTGGTGGAAAVNGNAGSSNSTVGLGGDGGAGGNSTIGPNTGGAGGDNTYASTSSPLRWETVVLLGKTTTDNSATFTTVLGGAGGGGGAGGSAGREGGGGGAGGGVLLLSVRKIVIGAAGAIEAKGGAGGAGDNDSGGGGGGGGGVLILIYDTLTNAGSITAGGGAAGAAAPPNGAAGTTGSTGTIIEFENRS